MNFTYTKKQQWEHPIFLTEEVYTALNTSREFCAPPGRCFLATSLSIFLNVIYGIFCMVIHYSEALQDAMNCHIVRPRCFSWAYILKYLFWTFRLFFEADILKTDLETSCSSNFSQSALLYVIKTHQSVRNCLFWRVYDSISCFTIVDNVTWMIFVAAISDRDWQPSWVFRPLWTS